MKKVIFVILGTITLVLGSIGIFIPILPTTPFLLLSAFFYVRSSKRMYDWLLRHKVFGKYLYNYITHKAIPVRVKISALILIWISITLCVILVGKLIVTILLPTIALFVSLYILSLKNLENNEEHEVKNDS